MWAGGEAEQGSIFQISYEVVNSAKVMLDHTDGKKETGKRGPSRPFIFSSLTQLIWAIEYRLVTLEKLGCAASRLGHEMAESPGCCMFINAKCL